MTGFHTRPGSSSRILVPAMLAIALLSGCAGVPPRLEAPGQATTSTLTRYNAHTCTPTVASALDAYRIPPEVVRDLFYTQRLSGQGQLVGYTAWMHLTTSPAPWSWMLIAHVSSSRPIPAVEQTFLAFIARSCEGQTCPEDQGACRIIGPSSDHHDLQLRSVTDAAGY